MICGSRMPSLKILLNIPWRGVFQGPALQVLKHFLYSWRKPLKLLNKNKFTDIYAQQIRAREVLVQIQTQLRWDPFNKDLLHHEDIRRQHYITITHSAIALMKQQSKVEWIGCGDECSRHFIAKIKQRKAMQCIYQIRDRNDPWVEGFDLSLIHIWRCRRRG